MLIFFLYQLKFIDVDMKYEAHLVFSETMTKLLEWLSLATIIGVVWAGAYTEMLLPQYRTELLWSPVVLVILFGVFSVLTIIYRCVILKYDSF